LITLVACSRAAAVRRQLEFARSSLKDAPVPHQLLLPLLLEDESDSVINAQQNGNCVAACQLQLPDAKRTPITLVFSACGSIGEWSVLYYSLTVTDSTNQ
jgi:hypothetical protein